MKKIHLITILLTLIIGSSVFADVVTTTRRINKKQEQQTQTQTAEKQIKKSGNTFADNIKTCRPYSERLNSSLAGVNFTFNVKIEGWVNDKCKLNFAAESKGINENFAQIHGVNPEDTQVLTFAPKIRCQFTKEQLEYVGDSILQEEARLSGAQKNMLKHPKDIDLSSFTKTSQADERLLDVVMSQDACTIINSDDLTQMMNQLLSF